MNKFKPSEDRRVEQLAEKLFVANWRPNDQYNHDIVINKAFSAAEVFLAIAEQRVTANVGSDN
jgi:hypothetical protein